MRTIRIVFLNSFSQLIGKVVTAGTTFFIAAIVARSLGQSGFGEFTLMTTFAAMFYMAADFGFNAVALREAGGDGEALKSSFQQLLGLRIVYSLGLIFIALAILSFFPYSGTVKLGTIVMILTILTQALYNTANLVFQSRFRYDLSVLASSLSAVLNLVLIYLLSQAGLTLFGIALSYVTAGVAMAGVALLFTKTLLGSYRPDFSFSQYPGLIAATLPVGIALIFNLIYFRADTFILSFFKGTTEVGTYGAAYKIFDNALVLPTFFMNALYPLLVKNYEENRERFRQIVRWSIIFLAGSATFGAILGIMLAPWLIRLIYGDGFEDSILPLQILLASAPIYFVSSIYMWLMLILRRQKTLALVYGFGMLLNVALNLKFIPLYSYNAAALTTGVSEAAILLLTYYLSRDWKK